MNNYSGEFTCPICLKRYKWEYSPIQGSRMSDPILNDKWVTFKDDVTRVLIDSTLSNNEKIVFKCNCPNCDKENTIICDKQCNK